MNGQLDVLVLGPRGEARTGVEETVRRLGHAVVEPNDPAGLPGGWSDVVVVDARDPRTDLDVLGTDADAPYLVLTDHPADATRALDRSVLGGIVLTGSQTDAGFHVALTLCAALRSGFGCEEYPEVAV